MHQKFPQRIITGLLMALVFLTLTSVSSTVVYAADEKSQSEVIKADNDRMTFISSNLMPFGALKDGQPIGFAVEILDEIIQRLGRNDTIEFGPWDVVYKRALNEPNTVLWPPSRTPEREELFKWVGPLIPEKIVFFARKDSGLVINSLEDAKKVKGIATVAGYASEKLLEKNGFTNLVSQRSPLQSPDALKFGRADLWISSNVSMKQTAIDANVDPTLFEPVYIVKEIPSYLAFSKTVSDELVNQFQKTLDEMKMDGSWERIISKWIPDELLRIGTDILDLNDKEQRWIGSHPRIRVVQFFQEPPFTMNKEDKHTGYLYELLAITLNLAGLQVEFIDGYTSYNDMVEALDKGEVDILTTMENTRELSDGIVRSVPVVRTPYALVAGADAPKIKRIEDLFGIKVAVVKGYAQDQHLDKFPQIIKVHVKNNEHGFKAVRDGRAVYFLNNLANAAYVLNKSFATDLRIAGTLPYLEFPPLALSFGIHGKESNNFLPGIINKALAAVPIHTLSMLRNKWLPLEFTVKSPERIDLTPEEEAFIKAHPFIRVHNEQSWAPFNFYDKGSATGFSIDYMNLLAKKIGMEVEYVSGPSWSEFLSMIKEGQLDVMLNIVKTIERQKFINFTEKPYIETPRAIVVRKDVNDILNLKDLYGKTVVVEKGFFYEGYLKKNHPEINITTVKDTADTLRTVANGDADATLGVIAVEQFLISKLFFSNLKLVVDPEEKALRSFDQFIGVKKDWPILKDILDKAMAAVTIEEKVEMSKRWMKQELIKSEVVRLTPEENDFLRKHPVLRVSNEMDYPPFDFAENGKPKGYSIEYLNLLAEKLGIKLEYVNGYTWSELLEKFQKRELDLIHSAMETEERRQYTAFTKPYLIQLHALVTRKNNVGIKSMEDMKGRTLALQRDYATSEFIVPNYPDINILWVSSTLEGLKAVAAGEADVVIDAQSVASYLIREYFFTNLTIANRIKFWGVDEQDLRIGVRSDWVILRAILEKAMSTVTRAEEAALRSKWFGLDQAVSQPKGVLLTSEEKEYLDKHPVLHIAFDSDWPPVEFSDKNHSMNGIAADYMQRMSELLGVKFEPGSPRSWKKMMEAVDKGELDFLSAISPTSQRKEWLDFSDTYLSFPIVIFTRKEVPYIGSVAELEGKPVAVVDGYASLDLLSENHPNLTLQTVQDVKEGLMNVSSGKAFAFIGSLAATSHIMGREGLADLKVSGETPYYYDLAIGTRKDNVILLQILNKALAAVTPQERNEIRSRWTSVTFEHKTDYSIVWQISAVAVLLLAFVLYWNRKLQTEVMERKRAERDAAMANQAKSEFLANMSHELRTPLNAILGFAQIMERNPKISSESENLKVIQRSGSHLLTLINQVLDLSKIEAGRVTVENNCFDFYHLLDELKKMMSVRADKKNLSLTADLDRNVPRYICTDEIKLRQVLINLLGNAVKFTDIGLVSLRVAGIDTGNQNQAAKGKGVERPSTDRDECTLQFEIEDTGLGIAPEEVKHIFEAFGQASTGKEIREGSGLGLVISNKFIQLLGGKMQLESELGKGSTFSFNIPVQIGDSENLTSELTSAAVVALEPGQPSFRMLIVDDKWDNRQLLVKMLEPFGFDLQEAADGKEAVEITKSWRPQVVWMDMRMPVMDGYEATRTIRAMDEVPHQPVVIAVTASVFEDKRGDVFKAGCDDIILKPYLVNEIIGMLEKYLSVKFVYDKKNDQEEIEVKAGPNQIKAADIRSLPKELLLKMEKAVELLDADSALSVVAEIRESNEVLANALQQLVEEYRFETIEKLLKKND